MSQFEGGGGPHPRSRGVPCPRSGVPHPRSGGYPIQTWSGGVPWVSPSRPGMGYPLPHLDLGWGAPPAGPGMGCPPSQTWDGVPPLARPGMGYPPPEMWTDKQTENSTFPHPLDAGGKNHQPLTLILQCYLNLGSTVTIRPTGPVFIQ